MSEGKTTGRTGKVSKHALGPHMQIPVILAVTGHRDLAEEHIEDVRATVCKTLKSLQKLLPSLTVACALAEGADQLVAEEARHLAIPLIAILPMPAALYRQTMHIGAARAFDHLVSDAEIVELPEVTQSGHAEPAATGLATAGDIEQGRNKDRYEQLALFLARRSHILLAVWDSVQDWNPLDAAQHERYRGGTSHLIYLRQESDDPDGIAARSCLFPDDLSRLDPERSGPILHVVAPRHEAAQTAQPMKPGLLRLWTEDSKKENGDGWALRERVDPGDFRTLQTLQDLNKRLCGLDEKDVKHQVIMLKPAGVPDPADQQARRCLLILQELQARVDLAAQAEQFWLIGKVIRRRRKPLMRLPGTILVFSILAPVLALLVECYASTTALAPLVIYTISFTLIMGTSKWLTVQGYQARFQDYRALAEALRVQIFWALSGVQEAVSDSYLRKQRDDLGWLRGALHGPSLYALLLANRMEEPYQEYVRSGWIDSQRRFFLGDAERCGKAFYNERRFIASDFIMRNALRFALVMICVTLALHLLHYHRAARFVLLGAVFAPVPAGSVKYWAEQFAFEEHGHAYRRIGRIFQTAAAKLAKQQDPALFKKIAKELGREALDENAEWLKYHRKRKIGAVQS